MTLFSDINRGDKVELAHPNGDRVTITVTDASARHIATDINHFSASDGWKVESITPAPPQRPTEPGIYKDKDGDLIAVFSSSRAVRVTSEDGTCVREASFIADDLRRVPEYAFAYLPFTKIGDSE